MQNYYEELRGKCQDGSQQYGDKFEKQTKLTDQLDVSSVLEPTHLQNIKSKGARINSLPDITTSCSTLVKQTGGQKKLSVAELIHLHDINLQTFSTTVPYPNTEESVSFVNETEKPTSQLDNTCSQISATKCLFPSTDSGLKKQTEQQILQSIAEPNSLESTYKHISLINPIADSTKSNITQQQIQDKNLLTVAEMIYLHDVTVEQQTFSPSSGRKNSPGIAKQTGKQTYQIGGGLTNLDNTNVPTETNCPSVNTRRLTRLGECIDQQRLHTLEAVTSLDNNSLEISQTNPLFANMKNTTRFEKQIHHHNMESEVEVINLDNGNLQMPSPNPLTEPAERSASLQNNNSSLVNQSDSQNSSVSLNEMNISTINLELPETVMGKSNIRFVKKNKKRKVHTNSDKIYFSKTRSQISKAMTQKAVCIKGSVSNNKAPVSCASKVQRRASPLAIVSESNASLTQYGNLKIAQIILERVDTIMGISHLATDNSMKIVNNSVRFRKHHKMNRRELRTQPVINQSRREILKNEQKKMKHRTQKMLCCEECGKNIINSGMKRHMRIHFGERPYKRDECGELFHTRGRFARHTPIHSGKYKFCCKQLNCAYMTNLQIRLVSHIRKKHIGERPFICDVCGGTYASQKSLNEHKLRHTGWYPFVCDQPDCSYKCRDQRSMEEHKCTKHTGERPYSCGECGKRFATSNGLKADIFRHAKVYPYKCKICPAKCLSKSTFENHLRIHNGDRPFRCDNCGARFRTKQQLKSHNFVHSGTYPYPCLLCDSKFEFKSQLCNHSRRYHQVC